MLPHTKLLPAIPQHRSSERCWLNPGPEPCLCPSLLCIPFMAQLPACLGPHPERDEEQHPPLQGHSTKHSPAHLLLGPIIVPGMAESTKLLYNLSLLFITSSELLQAVLLCFTMDLSTCFSGHHCWAHSQGAYNLPPADTHAPPLPTQGTMGQPPQQRLFPQRFDPKWNSSTDKEPCPALTHPRPVLGQHRATRVTFLGNW